MHELTEREKLVLNLIVHNFVMTVGPVSSRQLCKKYNLGVSPATIRNVMMDLEEKGYITQPHVSAGRVPTDQGYRVYVDSLMKSEKLSRKEKDIIYRDLRKVSRDIDLILQKASQVLGKVSHQLGIVLVPHFYEGIFEKLELVPISDTRTLLVISIRSGLVKTIMLELDFEISRENLETTARIINERLHGLRLKEIKETIDERLRNVSKGSPNLIHYFMRSADEVFNFENWEDFYYGGTSNILQQPEFSDHQRLEALMEVLEDRRTILQVLSRSSKEGKVTVTIGEENKLEKMRSCSVISTVYRVGNMRGVLGVIGPTRMHYAKIVPLVGYMSSMLSEILNN
ncbi:heat-inducible transcription repressor HrcA [candidate division KSB1 bacterium]|nr:MAG: heat-inducible transcription repressor HrcA [candidate division KSB1 bacterium]RKY86100.1 MAG: heat-inducible transcription repressor HrcA [candidate division KSB1 bacterium]